MKTSIKFFLTGIASLMAMTGLSITPASANLSSFTPPTDSETGGFGGFPESYTDRSGLKLDLCLAPSIDRPTPPNYCLTEPPDSTKPASVSKSDPALSNFPDEAFWWTAEADASNTRVRAILVLATEAAFANEEAIDGDQMVFNRTRIRIQALRPNIGLISGRKYKVTYPYGTKVLTATSKDPRRLPAAINITEDFGCVVTATAECNFGDVLAASGNRGRVLNPIGNPWLTWDSSAPAAPAGYIGDPNVDHKVTGGLNGVNYFRVEELAADGVTVVGQPIASTDLFSVSGKISAPAPAPAPAP